MAFNVKGPHLIIASQLPPDHWYGTIPSATIADAILDRIIHGAHKLHLTGESRRKNKNGKGTRSTSGADFPTDLVTAKT